MKQTRKSLINGSSAKKLRREILDRCKSIVDKPLTDLIIALQTKAYNEGYRDGYNDSMGEASAQGFGTPQQKDSDKQKDLKKTPLPDRQFLC